MEHKIIMRVDFASSADSTQRLEDALIGDRSDASASADFDKTFEISAANTLQALFCLSSLMRANADDSGRVCVYAELVEEKLQALGELLRPMLCNPALGKRAPEPEASNRSTPHIARA
jgi:hypothetical protein